MTPTSIAFDPTEPNAPVYAVSELNIFKTFTRASYFAAFGVQAPNFDSTRPAQYWFDSAQATAPPSTIVEYLQVQVAPTSTGVTIDEAPLPVPAVLASRPNIPGLISYPPYVVKGTAATSGGSAVNPTILSDYPDAIVLAVNLGLSPQAVIAGPALTWNGESRGDWMILLPGNPNPYYVGTLLAVQYAEGVGNPGGWSIENANTVLAQAVWRFVGHGPDGITSGVPTVTTPVPIRPLLGNEIFVSAGMGGGAMVARTDLAPPSVLGTATGFAQQDAVMLAAIYGLLFPNGPAQ